VSEDKSLNANKTCFAGESDSERARICAGEYLNAERQRYGPAHVCADD